jgi:ribosomal protein S27E
MFNNLEAYLSGADYSDVENTTECLEPNCTQKLFVNTNIISASIDSCQVCGTVLTEPIVFTLQHKQVRRTIEQLMRINCEDCS